MLVWLLACTGAPSEGAADTSQERDGAPADTQVVTDTDAALDTSDPCSEAMTVTWNSWGRGFLTESCQGCHASTATNRYGAPEEVVFDTVDDAWAWSDRILARAAGENPSMPPAGGVTDDDRTRLSWWLACGEPGS